MDKKERAMVVAVKLGEIISEERKKLEDMNEDSMQSARLLKEVQELIKSKDQLISMRKAADTYKKQIDERCEELTKNGGFPVTLELNKSIGYSSGENDYSIILKLKDPKDIKAKTNGNPNEIVTDVTRLRNHPNPRIKEAAQDGFKLVVDGDDQELLVKFLRL